MYFHVVEQLVLNLYLYIYKTREYPVNICTHQYNVFVMQQGGSKYSSFFGQKTCYEFKSSLAWHASRISKVDFDII